jgi:hypothetical protein
MIRWLLRLYPKRWRQRYGDEYHALLEDLDLGPRTIVGVAAHAARVHAQVRRTGLIQLAGIATFAAAERFAVSGGYGDNILWLPGSIRSLGLLLIAITGFGVAAAPVVRRTVKRLGRVARLT